MIVGFKTQHKTWQSKVINVITGTPVHCGIILPDNTVFQADSSRGVAIYTKEEAAFDSSWLLVNIADADDTKLAEIMKSEIGCKYDWSGALIGWSIGYQSNTDWFCSELCSYSLMLCGVILDRSNPAEYTPYRLYTELVSKYNV